MSRWLIAFSMAFAVCVGLTGSIDAAPIVDGNLGEFGITGVAGDLLVADASLINLYPPNYSYPATQYINNWGGGVWTHVVLRVRR